MPILSTPTKILLEIALVLFVALALFVSGMLAYRHFTAPPAPPTEAAAPAIAQAPTAATPNGSNVLARSATNTNAKAVAPLPAGGKLQRQIGLDIQPAKLVTQDEVGHAAPALHVDLSLVKMADNTQRVVASSPDGAVVGGLDVPTVEIPQSHPWAAGIAYGPIPGMNSAGIWAERDIGRVRIGVEYDRLTSARGVRNVAQVRVGWTW